MARITFERGDVRVVWEFPSATGEWEQSSLESARAGFAIGVFPLMREEGRQILINEYGLRDFAEELPLEKIRHMGPDALAKFKEEHAPA